MIDILIITNAAWFVVMLLYALRHVCVVRKLRGIASNALNKNNKCLDKWSLSQDKRIETLDKYKGVKLELFTLSNNYRTEANKVTHLENLLERIKNCTCVMRDENGRFVKHVKIADELLTYKKTFAKD